MEEVGSDDEDKYEDALDSLEGSIDKEVEGRNRIIMMYFLMQQINHMIV